MLAGNGVSSFARSDNGTPINPGDNVALHLAIDSVSPTVTLQLQQMPPHCANYSTNASCIPSYLGAGGSSSDSSSLTSYPIASNLTLQQCGTENGTSLYCIPDQSFMLPSSLSPGCYAIHIIGAAYNAGNGQMATPNALLGYYPIVAADGSNPGGPCD